MTTEVKARLTLDTSDFRKGTAEVDRADQEMRQKVDRRAVQADGQAAQRTQAQSEREARRLADREARERLAAERTTARAARDAEREAKRLADAEARETAAGRRREERATAETQKAAERASRTAAAAQRAAEQEVANQNKQATHRAGQLQLQLNDVFTSIGSGQNPLTVAIQQGPQITQIYGGLANTIAAIPKGLLLAGAAAGAFFGILAAGVAASTATAERQRQFNIELQATGNIAAVTAARLDEIARAEASRPGADRAATAQALGTFSRNAAIQAEQDLARALGVARDLARVNRQELPDAAGDLNQSLDGTAAGARRLDAAYNILTAAEHEQIRLLDEQGRKVDVVNIVLAAAERRFKGLNEQGISPTSKYLNELGNAWTNFADKVGRSKLATGAMFVGTQTLKGAAMLFGGPPSPEPGTGNAPTPDDVARSRESLRVAEARLAQLQSQHENARPEAKPWVQAEIDKAKRGVADLKANLDYLSRQTAGAVEQQAAAQAASAQAEAQREAKEVQELIAKAGTVEAQRRQLAAERQRIADAVRGGGLAPEALKQAGERLQQIDGQLAGLATTSQKLQRDLDLEGELAKLPPHLQALERAWRTTYRTAKEAGDDEAAARAKADQARATAATQQATATQQQIALLGDEARAALDVAAAYGQSRAAGLRTAATSAARSAEAQGQIAPGTAGAVAQETLDKNAAATVAAAAEKNRAYEDEIAALQRLVSAEAVSAEAAREAERVNRVAAYAAELRAQAEASGSVAIVAAAERQIAKYDELSRKQLELDRVRAANQFNAQFDPNTAYAQQMAQLAELQATGQLTARSVAEATKQYEQQRLEASRDATDGMVAGLRRYADEATNAGRAASEGIASGMRAAEDAALGAFGLIKMSGTDMVNSLLADIARLAIRQSITGPIASAVSSAIPSIGGWLGGLFGSSGANVPGIGTGTGYTYHQGGVAGAGGVPTRALPVAAWDGAPRLHKGGIPGLGANEVPTILERGEEVLTEDDPRHRFNLGRRRGGGDMIVNIQPPAGHEARAERSERADGATQLDIMFEQIEGRMADNVGRWRGPLFGAMAATFGVQPVGRRS